VCVNPLMFQGDKENDNLLGTRGIKSNSALHAMEYQKRSELLFTQLKWHTHHDGVRTEWEGS
jgi:hypothetical protein